MGVSLNPRNDGFRKAIRSEIYADKTGLIACMNKYLDTEQQNICISRPRRFGKSMALNMLAAYYSCGCDSRELFAGLKIERFLPLPFCKKPALVVELKYDKSAETAISQIKDRGYAQALEGCFGDVLLVGVNYDRDSINKPHSCVIEKLAYGQLP